MLEQFFTYDSAKNTGLFSLKVKTKAKNNSIDGIVRINDKQYLKLSIKALPESGKANKAIIEFLSKSFKIPQRNFVIVSGASSSNKIISIKNVELDLLNHALGNYIKG